MRSIQPAGEALSKSVVVSAQGLRGTLGDYAALSMNFEGVPEELKKFPRWLVYKLQPRKGRADKYDKIPYQPAHPDRKASTNNYSHYASYEEACTTCNNAQFDGLGFAITDSENLVVIDLDHCIDFVTGELSNTAVEFVESLPGYWEYSPSGRGYRGIFKGTLPGSDINNAAGVEFYGGSSARFFTVTGHKLDGSTSGLTMADPRTLLQFYDRYKPERSESQDYNCPMPERLPTEDLPDINKRVSLGVSRELEEGLEGDDRSKRLQIISKDLYTAGFDDQQVLSILAENHGSMAVALDHRRDDYGKALTYLWRHHCIPARVHRIKFESFGAKTIDRNLKPFDIPPRVFLLDSIIQKGLLGSIVAPGGTSKSSLSLAMAVAVATGIEITGHTVRTQGNVWVINNEEPEDELQRRLMAICQRHEIPWHALEGKLFMNSGFTESYLLAKKTDQGVTATAIVDHIIEEIRKNNITLLILDPFVSMHSVPENSNEEQQQVINHIRHIAGKTGCAVLLVHHTAKTGGDSEAHAGIADYSRGASAVVAALRNAQTLARMSPTTANKLGFINEECRRMIRMDWAKSNYTLPPEGSTWYRMDTVTLLNGDPVGVPVPFDMEARCEELAAIQQREEAEKHQGQLIEILDVMTADEMPIKPIIQSLESRWGIKGTAIRDRLNKLIPDEKDSAVTVKSFFNQDWRLWKVKTGQSSRSAITIFREKAEMKDG
ncbi:MAG: AAA family ATPase [Candidatus Thiodiazotropha sp. (ex Codakia rugifera)]|nr:AAA family ATPase [Candidatus Thiodiazotropha sp. (ex Codakia rugifera)]